MQVFAWGYNNCGQIGSGDTVNQTAPRKVHALSKSLIVLLAWELLASFPGSPHMYCKQWKDRRCLGTISFVSRLFPHVPQAMERQAVPGNYQLCSQALPTCTASNGKLGGAWELLALFPGSPHMYCKQQKARRSLGTISFVPRLFPHVPQTIESQAEPGNYQLSSQALPTCTASNGKLGGPWELLALFPGSSHMYRKQQKARQCLGTISFVPRLSTHVPQAMESQAEPGNYQLRSQALHTCIANNGKLGGPWKLLAQFPGSSHMYCKQWKDRRGLGTISFVPRLSPHVLQVMERQAGPGNYQLDYYDKLKNFVINSSDIFIIFP